MTRAPSRPRDRVRDRVLASFAPPKIPRPFFVDAQNRGIVRGGFYDEMGGMLVGVNAQWVCDALNKAAGFAEVKR